MNRHFYISDDLDDLELVEEELESNGISTPHIHVLSLNDAEVARHKHLHEVEAVLRTDVGYHGIGILHLGRWLRRNTNEKQTFCTV